MSGTDFVDHEWYVHWLSVAVPAIFIVVTGVVLWFGVVPVAGRMIRRGESSGTYWTIAIVFGVCAAFLMANLIYPNWGIHVLQYLGILLPDP